MRPRRRRELEAAARLARAQGLFNVVGGAWPLVSGWIYAWARR